MGMFDELILEVPLPDGKSIKDVVFQTKDTPSQWLETYTINANGRFIHHAVRYEEVPLEERPNPKYPGMGSIRAIPIGDVDTNWNGYIHFIGGEESPYNYYRAGFTDGQLVSIELMEK